MTRMWDEGGSPGHRRGVDGPRCAAGGPRTTSSVPRSVDAGDRRHGERRGVREDEAHGVPHQTWAPGQDRGTRWNLGPGPYSRGDIARRRARRPWNRKPPENRRCHHEPRQRHPGRPTPPGFSEEARADMRRRAVGQVVSVLKGELPYSLINREVVQSKPAVATCPSQHSKGVFHGRAFDFELWSGGNRLAAAHQLEPSSASIA